MPDNDSSEQQKAQDDLRRSEGHAQAVEMAARSLAQLDCRVCLRCGRQAYQHRAIAGIGAVCPVAVTVFTTETTSQQPRASLQVTK